MPMAVILQTGVCFTSGGWFSKGSYSTSGITLLARSTRTAMTTASNDNNKQRERPAMTTTSNENDKQ